MHWDGGSSTSTSVDFYYSTDNGTTWALGGTFGFSGTAANFFPNGSFFIDKDDYAHVVYKDRNNGYIYYRRGTPNNGRSSYTWSSALVIYSLTHMNHPDIVAHKEGTGWRAHIVTSYISNTNNQTYYARVTITSSGGLTATEGAGGGATTDIATGVYNTSISTYPSIDFNHTGDGKTVAASTPHLYVGWTAGASGAGMGIRFRKATYSLGAWTWGTEREIDSGRYVNEDSFWINCLFDGTRIIFPGFVRHSGGTSIILHERNAADLNTTNTISRVLVSSVATSGTMYEGCATYDTDGNVYFISRHSLGNNTYGVSYRTWLRLNNIFDVQISFSTLPNTRYISAKRGFSNKRVEFVYTTYVTTTPYNVTFGGLK